MDNFIKEANKLVALKKAVIENYFKLNDTPLEERTPEIDAQIDLLDVLYDAYYKTN